MARGLNNAASFLALGDDGANLENRRSLTCLALKPRNSKVYLFDWPKCCRVMVMVYCWAAQKCSQPRFPVGRTIKTQPMLALLATSSSIRSRAPEMPCYLIEVAHNSTTCPTHDTPLTASCSALVTKRELRSLTLLCSSTGWRETRRVPMSVRMLQNKGSYRHKAEQ